jgi:mRNA-degrading endonuclease RelE of RelBE toxin-antitoxin system
MARRARFHIVYAPEVLEHLDSIERGHHRAIAREIVGQLSHTPLAETRNRKPLEQPARYGATWEIRCGPDNRFRVLYDVDPHQRTVSILAIGVKKGGRLVIGGEEFGS